MVAVRTSVKMGRRRMNGLHLARGIPGGNVGLEHFSNVRVVTDKSVVVGMADDALPIHDECRTKHRRIAGCRALHNATARSTHRRHHHLRASQLKNAAAHDTVGSMSLTVPIGQALHTRGQAAAHGPGVFWLTQAHNHDLQTRRMYFIIVLLQLSKVATAEYSTEVPQ